MLTATHRQGGSMSTSHCTSYTSGRTLHVVDLENLIGDPRATGAVAHDTLHRYLDAAGHIDGDHVILASNPGLVAEVAFRLDVPCSLHACKGIDGADTMLLALASPEFVARRYDRLVIGSGDGAFVSLARATRLAGVDVLVVARADGCARRLQKFPHVFLDLREELGDAA
jgi:hypothetical protein